MSAMKREKAQTEVIRVTVRFLVTVDMYLKGYITETYLSLVIMRIWKIVDTAMNLYTAADVMHSPEKLGSPISALHAVLIGIPTSPIIRSDTLKLTRSKLVLVRR